MVTKPLRMRQLPSEIKNDLDLEHRLVNFLHARHVPGTESVHFDVRRGTVVVSGPLGSARAKWLCIECCRHVAGVVKLVDELIVERRESEPAVFARIPQNSQTRVTRPLLT